MSRSRLACAGVIVLVTAMGCDDHSLPHLATPAVTIVHEKLPGGMLYHGWASTDYRTFLVGGADPVYCPPALTNGQLPDGSKRVANGVRALWEYDGARWSFLDTAPTNVDMASADAADMAAGDGTDMARAGASDGGVTDGHAADGGVVAADPLAGCSCDVDAGAMVRKVDGGTVHCDVPMQVGADIGPLYAIYGFSPRRFYVAGNRGVLLRVQPGSVEQMALADPQDPKFDVAGVDIRAMWGASENDFWAVGGYLAKGDTTSQSLIFHFDGNSWARVRDIPSGGRLLAIWGAAHDRVWAVGLAGEILYFDGTSWTQQTTPFGTEDLTAITGTDEKDVSAVGGTSKPLILHYDGKSWKKIETSIGDVNNGLLSILHLIQDLYVVSGIGNLVAFGKLDNLEQLPTFESASFHTIVPTFLGGFILAGGNVFDPNRTDLHGTVVSLGAPVSSTFEPRNETTGADFKTAQPPNVSGGGNGSGGW